MAPSVDSKPNRILDKLVARLAAIEEGSLYWYEPADVVREAVDMNTIAERPTEQLPYVTVQAGQEFRAQATDGSVSKDLYTLPITVRWHYFKQDASPTALSRIVERGLEDIRTAIFKSTTGEDGPSLDSNLANAMRVENARRTVETGRVGWVTAEIEVHCDYHRRIGA